MLYCLCTKHPGPLSCALFCSDAIYSCYATEPRPGFHSYLMICSFNCVGRLSHSSQALFISSSSLQSLLSQLSTHRRWPFLSLSREKGATCASSAPTHCPRMSPWNPSLLCCSSVHPPPSETLIFHSSGSRITPPLLVPSEIVWVLHYQNTPNFNRLPKFPSFHVLLFQSQTILKGTSCRLPPHALCFLLSLL